MITQEGGFTIFEQLIQRLQQDGWVVNVHHDSGFWLSAQKERQGFLITTMTPGQILSLPREHQVLLREGEWEALIFCPQGLSSQDLTQAALKPIQAWFIDMQTGSYFAYPPNPNGKTVEYIVSKLHSEDQPLPEEEENAPEVQALLAEKRTPYVTYTLMAVILLVYILMTTAGGSAKTTVLIAFGAKVNSLIQEGEIWRLFTSMFLHIGFIHLAFNLYALYALGPIAERLFGPGKYLLIYFISGISGSIASYLFTEAISAGASGAIFGLLGALALYARKKPALRQSALGKSLILVIAINLGIGVFQPGIDISAHVGGLLCGALIGRLLP